MTSVALTATAFAGPPRGQSTQRHNLALTTGPSFAVEAPRMRFLRDGLPGPDLTLTDVSFEAVKLRGAVKATRLRVTVKNAGNSDWRSERHQQALMAHIGNEPFLVTTNLKRLRAGASRTFTVNLPLLWGPGADEAPSVVLQLATDEDIYNDGNPANDDADESDNTLILPGETVNSMIAG